MGKKVKSVGIWSKALSYTQSDLHFSKPPHSKGGVDNNYRGPDCRVPFNVSDQKDPHSGFICSQNLHWGAPSAFNVISIRKLIITSLILPGPNQGLFLLKEQVF